MCPSMTFFPPSVHSFFFLFSFFFVSEHIYDCTCDVLLNKRLVRSTACISKCGIDDRGAPSVYS
jgi:hypothetical protein